jgi:hypothetical protein
LAELQTRGPKLSNEEFLLLATIPAKHRRFDARRDPAAGL